MEYSDIKKIYSVCSSFYDFLFKVFFYPRQKSGIASLNLPKGSRVLDVGVGTGLSLSLYPKDCDVVGVDLSVKMLKQAQKKVANLKMKHVDLLEMDGCNLAFKDDSFDCVVATHIVSVVPNPHALIDEIRRVCRPDGKLLIINHFISSHPILAKVEKKCDPFCRKLGWRMDMSLEDLVNSSNLDIYEKRRLNKKIDLWDIVHANNNKHEVEQNKKLSSDRVEF